MIDDYPVWHWLSVRKTMVVVENHDGRDNAWGHHEHYAVEIGSWTWFMSSGDRELFTSRRRIVRFPNCHVPVASGLGNLTRRRRADSSGRRWWCWESWSYTKKRIVRGDRHDLDHHVEEDGEGHQDCNSWKLSSDFFFLKVLLSQSLIRKTLIRIPENFGKDEDV